MWENVEISVRKCVEVSGGEERCGESMGESVLSFPIPPRTLPHISLHLPHIPPHFLSTPLMSLPTSLLTSHHTLKHTSLHPPHSPHMLFHTSPHLSPHFFTHSTPSPTPFHTSFHIYPHRQHTSRHPPHSPIITITSSLRSCRPSVYRTKMGESRQVSFPKAQQANLPACFPHCPF